MFIGAVHTKFTDLVGGEVLALLRVSFCAQCYVTGCGWPDFFHMLFSATITEFTKTRLKILADTIHFQFLSSFFWNMNSMFEVDQRDVASILSKTKKSIEKKSGLTVLEWLVLTSESCQKVPKIKFLIISLADSKAPPIRYLPSLLIQFLGTVCTASCRM